MNTLLPILDFYIARGREAAWTQNANARDGAGKKIHTSSDKARRWCLSSALYLSIPEKDGRQAARKEIRRRIGSERIQEWNDAAGGGGALGTSWPDVEWMLIQDDGSAALCGSERIHQEFMALAEQADPVIWKYALENFDEVSISAERTALDLIRLDPADLAAAQAWVMTARESLLEMLSERVAPTWVRGESARRRIREEQP